MGMTWYHFESGLGKGGEGATQHKHHTDPILNTNYRHFHQDQEAHLSKFRFPFMLEKLQKEKWDIYRANLPTPDEIEDQQRKHGLSHLALITQNYQNSHPYKLSPTLPGPRPPTLGDGMSSAIYTT